MFIPLLIAVAATILTILYRRLYYARFQQHAHLPQCPNSLAWGHLKLFGQFLKRGPPNGHPDMAISLMHRELGRPPLMFIDLRPFDNPLLVVGSHDVAEQTTKASDIFPTSPPKGKNSFDRLLYIIGASSILSRHGDEWKMLRKRFSPGFAPQYLNSFVPEVVLDKGLVFLERLDKLAKSGETFGLLKLTTQLTLDVIGKVSMDFELNSQTESSEFVELFDALLETYHGETRNRPWWFTPGRIRRRAALAGKVNGLLEDIVRRKHAAASLDHGAGGGSKTRKARSILSLCLQDVTTLTPTILNETCDQLRTFLFAGHDTTSILISWVFYELSRTPHALKAVRAELDKVLGADDISPAAMHTRLLGIPDLVQQIPYLCAVIKETLRVHPSAGTARQFPEGSGFSVTLPDGTRQCLDGMITYNCQPVIHTDPSVYGEDTAEDFLPERWLSAGAAEIPAGAWRPFERGPRACIGQELALVEARLIIALAVRQYDFVKVGLGEVVLDEGGKPTLDTETKKGRQYKVAEELYPVRAVTSKPVDGMKMKVKMAT